MWHIPPTFPSPGLPRWLHGIKRERKEKEICLQCRRWGFNPWVRKFPWRRKLQPSLVFLSQKSHGQRSLVGYSSWGRRRVKHDLTPEHQHDPFPVWRTLNTFIVSQHKELVDLGLLSLWIKASFQVSVRRQPIHLSPFPRSPVLIMEEMKLTVLTWYCLLQLFFACVNLKQIDCQIFSSKDGFIWDQQRIAIQSLQKMVSHMQVHPCHGEENASIEGKGRWEGHGKQSAHTWSLKEDLVFFLPVGLCYNCRIWELSGLQIFCNWGYCLVIFCTEPRGPDCSESLQNPHKA